MQLLSKASVDNKLLFDGENSLILFSLNNWWDWDSYLNNYIFRALRLIFSLFVPPPFVGWQSLISDASIQCNCLHSHTNNAHLTTNLEKSYLIAQLYPSFLFTVTPLELMCTKWIILQSYSYCTSVLFIKPPRIYLAIQAFCALLFRRHSGSINILLEIWVNYILPTIWIAKIWIVLWVT